MTVTNVIELNKSRSKIIIDEEFAFVLYKGELRIYGIEEGKDMEESVFHEIINEVLPKRAKLRCMNLLASKRYTRKQLEDKLRRSFYPENVITEALDYVESYGYVDDNLFATDYIEFNKERKSRSKIRMELLKKGIPKEVADQIWDETVTENHEDLEREQILAYLSKKNYDSNTASFQEKNKLFSYFYRKGFQIDVIRSVLSLDITSI